MKIKDHNGLFKEVLTVRLERNAQPEYGQNAVYCVHFKDTTFSYFEDDVDTVEIGGDLSIFVKLYNTELMTYMLQTVLNTFGRTDGVCVTTQTKQRVIENIRELLESIEHGR
ncbi:hypothetical protein AVIO78A_014 [Escherichia phage vB_EcoS_AVIO78A]|nr:hypothetical protein AVIO78A_014 [Escherichia phage vB_EcoS_AVIO78A]